MCPNRKSTEEQLLEDAKLPVLRMHEISRHGICTKVRHVSEAELEAILFECSITPLSVRADGMALYNPLAVRAAYKLYRLAHATHRQKSEPRS